jgi:hypothetical protein
MNVDSLNEVKKNRKQEKTLFFERDGRILLGNFLRKDPDLFFLFSFSRHFLYPMKND